jgi:hypothetical protein
MSPSNKDAQTEDMTPHLAPTDESPQGLQNRQGTTISATFAVSLSSIAATATATTTAVVGKVSDAGPVDDKSAKEDHGDGNVSNADPVDRKSSKEGHGDGKVGDANPVDNKSAKEGHIILYNSYNWIIEGGEDMMENERKRHMNAFYTLIKKWMRGKEYTSQIINKEGYNERVNFFLRVREGNIDCREGYLTGNVNAYKWLKKYHVFTIGDSAVLVLRPSPKKSGAVDVTGMPFDIFQQPTYVE